MSQEDNGSNDPVPPPPPPRRQPIRQVITNETDTAENDACDPEWISVIDDAEDISKVPAPPMFEAPKLPDIFDQGPKPLTSAFDNLNLIDLATNPFTDTTADVATDSKSSRPPFITHHPIYVAPYKHNSEISFPEKQIPAGLPHCEGKSGDKGQNWIITHHPIYVAPFSFPSSGASADIEKMSAETSQDKSNGSSKGISEIGGFKREASPNKMPSRDLIKEDKVPMIKNSLLPVQQVFHIKKASQSDADVVQKIGLFDKILNKFTRIDLIQTGGIEMKAVDIDQVRKQGPGIFQIFLIEYHNSRIKESPNLKKLIDDLHTDVQKSSLQYQIGVQMKKLNLQLKSAFPDQSLKFQEQKLEICADEFDWMKIISILNDNYLVFEKNPTLRENIDSLHTTFASRNIYFWIAQNGGWKTVLHLHPQRQLTKGTLLGLGSVAVVLSLGVILLIKLK